MKKLQVTITLDMDIPEDWTLVDHPDGGPVLTVDDGRYMYMSFLPMFTDSLEPESDWTSERSDKVAVQILDMIQYEKVEMKIVVT
jgi:hypothetical protein